MDEITATVLFGPGGGTYVGAKKAQSRQKKLIKEYEKSYKKAYEENLARYNQILGEMSQLYDRQMSQLDTRGESQRREIGTAAQRSRAAVAQNLASSGMGSSTIAQTMRNSVSRQQANDLVGLRESLSRERMDLDRGLTSQRHSFMQSRTDAYPDLGYLQLQLGMAGQPSPFMQGLDRTINEIYRGVGAFSDFSSQNPSGASTQPQHTQPQRTSPGGTQYMSDSRTNTQQGGR